MRLLISFVSALALSAIGVLVLTFMLPQHPAKIIVLLIMGILSTGILTYSIHAFLDHRRE